MKGIPFTRFRGPLPSHANPRLKTVPVAQEGAPGTVHVQIHGGGVCWMTQAEYDAEVASGRGRVSLVED